MAKYEERKEKKWEMECGSVGGVDEGGGCGGLGAPGGPVGTCGGQGVVWRWRAVQAARQRTKPCNWAGSRWQSAVRAAGRRVHGQKDALLGVFTHLCCPYCCLRRLPIVAGLLGWRWGGPLQHKQALMHAAGMCIREQKPSI